MKLLLYNTRVRAYQHFRSDEMSQWPPRLPMLGASQSDTRSLDTHHAVLIAAVIHAGLSAYHRCLVFTIKVRHNKSPNYAVRHLFIVFTAQSIVIHCCSGEQCVAAYFTLLCSGAIYKQLPTTVLRIGAHRYNILGE